MIKQYCPKCGKIFDAHTFLEKNVDNTKPRPGDVTVCIGCTEILVFKKNLSLEKLSLEKLDELDSDIIQCLDKVIRAIKLSKKQSNEKPKV